MISNLKRILLLSILFLIPLRASAADITTTVCTTASHAGCIDFAVANQGSIGIQITGTWVGTITFQSSIGNATFTSLRMVSSADTSSAGVTTTTGNGSWQTTTAGLSTVRVVFTAFTSGTATVISRVTQVAGKFSGASGGGGGGSGTVTSLSATTPITITPDPTTTTGTVECATCLTTATGGPIDATYIVQTANAALTAEQALGALATGIVKNTTTTGVLSIAASGTDYVIPAGNVATATALAANGTNCTAGQFPLGIDASGNSETCTALPTTIVGTANQITASAATGTVTLSIPTNPVFSGTAVTFPGLLSIASGKVATINNTITWNSTDGITITTPTTSFTTARTDAANTFTGNQTIAALVGPVTITEAVGSSGLTVTGATQVSSFPAITSTQTWNASGTTFIGWKQAITSTASAAASAFLDFTLVGTSNRVNVSKLGTITLTSAGSVNNTLTIGNGDSHTIDFTSNALGVTLRLLGDNTGSGGPAEIRLGSTGLIAWNSVASLASGALDTYIYRDAANTLALRNSTNAQRFNLYNTYTSASVFENVSLYFASNVAHLGTATTGATARVFQVDYGGTTTSAMSIPITSGDITFGGVLAPTGYKSSDGTAGVTGTCAGFPVVKNGLVVACTGI